MKKNTFKPVTPTASRGSWLTEERRNLASKELRVCTYCMIDLLLGTSLQPQADGANELEA